MFGGPINGLQADVLPADENGAPLAPSRDINLIGLAWVLPGVLEPLVLAHMYSLFASPYRVFFLASAALMVLQVGLLLILSLCDLWLTLVALFLTRFGAFYSCRCCLVCDRVWYSFYTFIGWFIYKRSFI